MTPTEYEAWVAHMKACKGKWIAVPLAFIDQRGREMPCKVGRIIEVQPTLISVQFFGYPTPWDYSMREAQYFTLNPYQP